MVCVTLQELTVTCNVWNKENSEICQRSLQSLFAEISGRKPEWSFELQVKHYFTANVLTRYQWSAVQSA